MRTRVELRGAAPDGMAAKDAILAVKAKIDLAAEEQGAFEQSGAEKFPKLLRFATTPVARAGWMQKDDGGVDGHR